MDPASPLDQLASTSRKESIRRRKGAAQLSSKHERWEHGNSEGMAREDSGMGSSNEMRAEEWPATSDRAADPAAYEEGDEQLGNVNPSRHPLNPMFDIPSATLEDYASSRNSPTIPEFPLPSSRAHGRLASATSSPAVVAPNVPGLKRINSGRNYPQVLGIGGNDARSQVGDRATWYSEDYTKELAEGDDKFHYDIYRFEDDEVLEEPVQRVKETLYHRQPRTSSLHPSSSSSYPNHNEAVPGSSLESSIFPHSRSKSHLDPSYDSPPPQPRTSSYSHSSSGQMPQSLSSSMTTSIVNYSRPLRSNSGGTNIPTSPNLLSTAAAHEKGAKEDEIVGYRQVIDEREAAERQLGEVRSISTSASTFPSAPRRPPVSPSTIISTARYRPTPTTTTDNPTSRGSLPRGAMMLPQLSPSGFNSPPNSSDTLSSRISFISISPSVSQTSLNSTGKNKKEKKKLWQKFQRSYDPTIEESVPTQSRSITKRMSELGGRFCSNPSEVYHPPSNSHGVTDAMFIGNPSTEIGGADKEGPRINLAERERSSRINSVYSDYSFYDLPAEGASPLVDSNKVFHPPIPSSSKDEPDMLNSKSATFSKARVHTGSLRVPTMQIDLAVELLQLGIQYHESGDLERAADYFFRSVEACPAPISCLLWGLTLRHGWGVAVNPELGFKFIQRAAEMVVTSLDKILKENQGEETTKAVQAELVLALHELGTSYRFGWGCTKDKTIAANYFELAANLGDPDAQVDLAFCFANGKGVEKDLKKAAKYYRLAVAQGAESFGLSWIYKDKYMD